MVGAGPAREEGGRARAAARAVGQDLARPGLARRHRLLRARRPPGATSTSSASTRSATAARPASATPGRSQPRSSAAIAEGDLVACAVLSGNRNFEARIHPEVKANYLASPPLVVAYALAGRIDIDLESEPLGQTPDGDDGVPRRPLAEHGRDRGGGRRARSRARCSTRTYARRLHGRRDLARRSPAPRATSTPGTPTRPTSGARRTSTGSTLEPARARRRSTGARCLVSLGDSVTTDHISPAGVDPARVAGRPLPDRARRRAGRLQLLRRPARQPRGDGARHVRERAPAQPARARLRGQLDAALPLGRGDDDLRRLGALPAPRGRR